MPDIGQVLPQWAPRVKKAMIRRLYLLDAQGIHDDELIDEVGFGLMARCESFITACKATSGEVTCPCCGRLISHDRDKTRLLVCPACGWELTWGAYFATIQHKQLSGADPVLRLFEEYLEIFPKTKTPQEKMFAIDRLLHGFHWRVKYGPTRPVAVNLIEGRLRDVIEFLDTLSYGEKSTPGIEAEKTTWDKKSQNARGWAFKNK